MPVTIKQIAKMLDLSPATISLALNGSPLVAQKTRELVCAKADELDYVPNNFGRGLQSRKSRLIGYMCLTVTNAFNAETLEGCGRIAAQRGYGVITGFAGQHFEHFNEQLQLFLEKNVDGIILSLDRVFDGEKFPEFMRKVEKRKVPVVMCATDSLNVKFPSILNSNFNGGYMAVDHMIKLGHRNLIIPSEPMPFNRISGHMAACREHNLPDPIQISDPPEDIVEVVKANPQITGIVCSCDYVAAALIWRLRGAGYRVPEDISVIGYDDVWYAERYEYNLTTVAQQRSEFGELSMKTILGMIDGEAIEKLQLIEPELIVRGTTAPAKQN